MLAMKCMASSRRYIITSALFIQLLMLSAVASPLTDGINPLGDYAKMNNDLIDELEPVSYTHLTLPTSHNV